ncbi:MAG: 2,3-bisphosphoglycerate-independent phosphoglycerate mutase [Syntrophales bacterium]|jgi:2,3-bisphosphoglycerate-independent phosphoglycerate mutase|nr:2,3-bisphosphoglycerate-independent phosphoglycerate mutase [Syntrophales bacterium]MCK9528252.1 2,3-bisphosphoglycerate-independent phosphoglycerate mutase [Syntrophales bacterium]MDX9922383.1 2,3-bisphosphoglycerate-independent phosphoglycerate mutase [Syntrophales bacterium]
MDPELIDRLVVENDTKIVFLIMDGLGGLPREPEGLTELEAARTPHLDGLAAHSVCGLLDPVGFGITPGSGPAHFALFGYDPIKTNVGRGLLSAAGIDFPMSEDDLFARVNFATIDGDGRVSDRRAGRIDTTTNRRICEKLTEEINLGGGIEVFLEPEKEHRALLVLRGKGLSARISDTDPQKTGRKPLTPQPLNPEAKETADLVGNLLEQAGEILADEEQANMILLRGFARYEKIRTLQERFRLKSLAIAEYPMYRGISRLLGMDIHPLTGSLEGQMAALAEQYPRYDFFFIHIKQTDSCGEDGDYDGKTAVIEATDRLLPLILELQPHVLVVTGDHSTPAAMAAHSWHPVPVLVASPLARPDRVTRFGERDCAAGGLSRMPMVHLMGVALAHAGRLTKFGA